MSSFNQETLETIFHALRERAEATSNISRTGLTVAIRKAAEEDMQATYKAWKEVEKELGKIKK
jgi:hypothetical protein